ncbi:MAG: hypothetical protein D6698_17600, partial [Gammaproteobacteria bacterium]
LLPLFVGAQTLSGNERLRVIDGDTIWMPTINDIINLMGSGGALTSVGLTMPGGFSVSNSPLTSDGVISVTNNMAAGFVKSTGVGGAFTTVPTIDLNSDVSGTLPVTNGGTGLDTLGDPGQVLVVDNSGSGLTWSTVPTGSGTPNYIPKWLNVGGLGNSVMYQGTNGHVGFNTTSPNYVIDGQTLGGSTDALRLTTNSSNRYITFSNNQFVHATGNLDYTDNVGLRVFSTSNNSPFFELGTASSHAGFTYTTSGASNNNNLRLGVGSTTPYQFTWRNDFGTGRYFINMTSNSNMIFGLKGLSSSDDGIYLELPSNTYGDAIHYKKGSSTAFMVTSDGRVFAREGGSLTSPDFAAVNNNGTGLAINSTDVRLRTHRPLQEGLRPE